MRTIVLLLIGLTGGLLLAQWAQRPSPDPAPGLQLQTEPVAAETAIEAAPATVALQVARHGERTVTALATIVGDERTLLAPIAAFVGAQRLTARSASGHQAEAPVVLAADERTGIALLQLDRPLPDTQTLQPDTSDGSLYMGRELLLLTGGSPYRATVAAAGVRDELGAYNYQLSIGSFTGEGPASAIVDPAQQALLGLVRGDHSATTAVALDIGPVNALLAQAQRAPQPMTLTEYADYYYRQTSVGRIAWLKNRIAVGDYEQAVEFGRQTLHLDEYTRRHGSRLMHQAYAFAAQQLLQQSDWAAALALLDDAAVTVGLSDSLRLMRVEALQAVGDLRGALNDLLALSDPEPHRVRRLVIENALAAGQDGGTSLSLLREALAADPDYAPYHRLLGELLARRGDMQGALASLEQALALDPALAAEIDPLLQRLRARRNTPPVTTVPIQRRRNTLFVNARINGSTETYRFLFDTGASYTAITSATALRLGINDIFFRAPVVALETANGRIYTTTARLQSIDVSGARVDNVEAVILESMGGVDGLLGQSFLRHFDINIDRSAGVLVFNRRIGD
ncbi:MAG: retroviral-like aspartic protease family protein [Gammaproteobacteria bacterium]|nr:retroviral-like aspartic protease family protein [Gammaproteobacteria bacterium]